MSRFRSTMRVISMVTMVSWHHSLHGDPAFGSEDAKNLGWTVKTQDPLVPEVQIHLKARATDGVNVIILEYVVPAEP